MSAYYNEFDPVKAAVLREAIKAKAIADGHVDERNIKDVQPSDLMGYTQVHLFAGGGFWSVAARRAGWPDSRPMWSCSAPCPSFSAAGKGGGFSDPRHLWPDGARLVRKCSPPVIFGEQADDAIGYGWLDLVQADLEAEAYAVGKAVLGACSVGAPHIRQRLYFVGELADSERGFDERHRLPMGGAQGRAEATGHERQRIRPEPVDGCVPCSLGHAEGKRFPERIAAPRANGEAIEPPEGPGSERGGHADPDDVLNGFWRDAEWIPCRVPKVPGAIKWRAIKRGTFVLAARYPERLAELRIAGDAINLEVAAAFIRAYDGS